MSTKPKVIAIVGPTASGKTALAIALAQAFTGEVISADSRQVYRGLDLGTGKVTKDEMAGIPHHLLDIAGPMEIYTGADFVRDATVTLTDIEKRGRQPIVAGGSFFYFDLLRGKLQSAPVEPNELFRASINDLSNASLLEMLYTKDPARAATIDTDNRRRLIRALEIVEAIGTVPKPATPDSPYQWLIIGLTIEKERLERNITTRLHTRIKAGMIEEVVQLHQAGVTYERMHELGLEYRYIASYLQGKLTKDEMLLQLEAKSRQFAKRQMTWLKRDQDIEWYEPENRSAIMERVSTFLHDQAS